MAIPSQGLEQHTGHPRSYPLKLHANTSTGNKACHGNFLTKSRCGEMREAIQQLKKEAIESFRSRFGVQPTKLVMAPGRINLMGEHLDYNDGYVLPAAIAKYTLMAARPTPDKPQNVATFYTKGLNETAQISLASHSRLRRGGWQSYLTGVLVGFAKVAGMIPAFDAAIVSNIPLGAGLSSSAALEVATATLLEALTGFHLQPQEKAILCQQAENQFAGVPCGIMDPFTCIHGQANNVIFLDCHSHEYEYIPLPDVELVLLVINTMVQHELGNSEYETRRQECAAALAKLNQPSWRCVSPGDLQAHRSRLSEREYHRARHVVSEIERTQNMVAALREGDLEAIAHLMHASHASLRDDFQVSCKELDLLVDITQKLSLPERIFGTRMTGGGFGGCTVSLVHRSNAKKLMREISSRYQAQTGIQPNGFITPLTEGACTLPLTFVR